MVFFFGSDEFLIEKDTYELCIILIYMYDFHRSSSLVTCDNSQQNRPVQPSIFALSTLQLIRIG